MFANHIYSDILIMHDQHRPAYFLTINNTNILIMTRKQMRDYIQNKVTAMRQKNMLYYV